MNTIARLKLSQTRTRARRRTLRGGPLLIGKYIIGGCRDIGRRSRSNQLARVSRNLSSPETRPELDPLAGFWRSLATESKLLPRKWRGTGDETVSSLFDHAVNNSAIHILPPTPITVNPSKFLRA